MWAEKDPEEAAKWLVKLDNLVDFKKAAIQEVAIAWSKKSPIKAAKWFLSFNDMSAQSRNTYAKIACEWLKKDPERAIEWVKNLKDRESREWSIHQLVKEWAKLEPRSAAQWVALNAYSNSATLSAFTRSWAEKDPKKALEWYMSMGTGKYSSLMVVEDVVQLWAKKGPFHAIKWLSKFRHKNEIKPNLSYTYFELTYELSKRDLREAFIFSLNHFDSDYKSNYGIGWTNVLRIFMLNDPSEAIRLTKIYLNHNKFDFHKSQAAKLLAEEGDLDAALSLVETIIDLEEKKSSKIEIYKIYNRKELVWN